MVFTLGFMLFISFWRVDTDGVERWIINDGFQLEEEILQATEGTRNDDDEHKLQVWSVMDGIVYLSPFICRDPHLPCWFLSFLISWHASFFGRHRCEPLSLEVFSELWN
jgi:hypothetical protein